MPALLVARDRPVPLDRDGQRGRFPVAEEPPAFVVQQHLVRISDLDLGHHAAHHGSAEPRPLVPVRDLGETQEGLAVVTQCRNELEHFRPLPAREIMRLQVAASDLLDEIGPFVARFQ
jgi:hypothetical protein